MADGQVLTDDVTYMPFGPEDSMTLGDDVLTIYMDYNERYLLTDIHAGSVADYGYTHDDAGNVRTISGLEVPSFTPGTAHYHHEVGNRLTGVTGAISETYTYDDNGNIKSDGTRTFVYNQNNRLIQVKVGATVVGEYAYDAFGRRVKKVASGVTTIYDYDVAGNLISESEADGTPLRDIVYQNGERVAMRLYGSQAGWYYFVNDHLGTPRKVVDSSGVVVWQAAYLPFGKAQVLAGSSITNNFRFPGQYYDAETDLHYNWNRYYMPAKGRYLTADPIGLEAGMNLYAYVMDNPVNFIDTNGKEVYFCHGTYTTYPHSVVCVDTLCLGLMPDIGRGVVIDFIGAITFVTGHLEKKPFEMEFCKEMKIDQSCDQKEYEECILEIFQKEISDGNLPYSATIYNCTSWAKDVIISCQQKACSDD